MSVFPENLNNAISPFFLAGRSSIYEGEEFMGRAPVFRVFRKAFGKEFFFVGDFHVEHDEKEREGKEMTYDRVIYEETECEEDESGIYRMADEGVGSGHDEGRLGIRFGNDAETARAMSEQSGSSEEYAGRDKGESYDILRAEGLTNRMEKSEISEYRELCRDERDAERRCIPVGHIWSGQIFLKGMF